MTDEFYDDYDEEVQTDYFPKRKKEIEIPNFLRSENDIPQNEDVSAVLNNVPGNTKIEEMNHLNGLEKYAQNLTEEEWKRYLYYAPSQMMFTELQRRMSGYEEYRKALKDADGVMENIKL